MLWVFHVGVDLFNTGWFVESLGSSDDNQDDQASLTPHLLQSARAVARSTTGQLLVTLAEHAGTQAMIPG